MAAPTVVWEHLEHYQGDYMYRSKVPGGWLVKICDQHEVTSELGTNSNFRTSIIFLADPNHEWLKEQAPKLYTAEEMIKFANHVYTNYESFSLSFQDWLNEYSHNSEQFTGEEMRTCPGCDGNGEIKPDVQCKKCEGSGLIPV